MQIEKNKIVSLTYTLKENDANGQVIEITNETAPLTFMYGVGMMLPHFESHLQNLKAGDSYEMILPAQEAYGETNPHAVIDLDKEIFRVNGEIDENMLSLGNVIPMSDNQGNMLQGKVMGVTDTMVKMDFNHPMAGKTLHFTGKILEVREPTEAELEHGHSHGCDCSGSCDSGSCESSDCGSGCNC